ncbi:6-carboxytetrahydropterin synthase [bacterium]|nr:6-carboxytetrahydropterin synthase [bacterium]
MRLQTSGFFATAHFLSKYDGACSNIHGHTYAYYVCIDTINGYDNKKINELNNGILFDFSFIKKMFDHKLIIEKGSITPIIMDNLNNLFTVLEMEDNPTAENMAFLIKRKIYEQIGIKNIDNCVVRVWEDVKSLIDQKVLQRGEGEFIEV